MFSENAHVSQRSVGRVKRFKRRVKQRFGRIGPIGILPFRGHGTPTRVFVRGRVLEAKGITRKEDAHDGAWTGFLASVRRFDSEEIPGVELSVRIGDTRVTTRTDDQGYFDVAVDLSAPLEPGWHDVQLEILPSWVGGERTRATGHVLVPPHDAEFGVISDLDDTVIASGATDRLKMVRIVLFQNAQARIPFPGASAFFRALKLGSDGRRANPIFYLSRSPWSLYDLFETFLAVNDIPRGPLFLRDLRRGDTRSAALGSGQDKLTRIRTLMELYPGMKFVLIGNSGQRDPEVFRLISHELPDRVRAVYLRDASRGRRHRVVEAIAREIEALGAPVLRTESAEEAARHAAHIGLIAPHPPPAVPGPAEESS